MMSYGEEEVVNAAAFNLFTEHFVKFEQYFVQKLTMLWAIWAQIRSSMYLRWNCISFYELSKSLKAGIGQF